MKQNPTYGIWFTYPEELSLKWIGDAPAPRSGLRLRLWIAFHYIRSNGKGGRFLELIRYSMKALAFCLNPSHTSASRIYDRTRGLSGRDIAEEWNSFECDHN